ncbi:YcbK family protein [Gallaecimonas kandeliae]|uniref:YcbK family protein n=1 Tax=Gallaecimonas kandeliae TaxID=3029055 RepID=UPI0026471C27|nr:YcbK family protein [Gallaecimonas kandeliae]WKE66281.1 YcbK family protein [Gallaecimonas kandeliae]
MQGKVLSRRHFLFGVGALAAASVIPGKAMASVGHKRALSLVNLHTGDQADGIYWQNGLYQQDTLQSFNQVLKDHRSGDVTHMDPVLFDQLTHLTGKLGFEGTIQVISGYRSPASNAAMKKAGHHVATHSFHTMGRAIDIRLPGIKLADAHRAALSMKAGGVGYYPHDNFIHIDTGPVRRWNG